MKQEEIDAMTAANAKADEIFTANKLGRDVADPVFSSDEVHFKELPDDLIPGKNVKGDQMPVTMTMIITKNSIGITAPTVPISLI